MSMDFKESGPHNVLPCLKIESDLNKIGDVWDIQSGMKRKPVVDFVFFVAIRSNSRRKIDWMQKKK